MAKTNKSIAAWAEQNSLKVYDGVAFQEVDGYLLSYGVIDNSGSPYFAISIPVNNQGWEKASRRQRSRSSSSPLKR